MSRFRTRTIQHDLGPTFGPHHIQLNSLLVKEDRNLLLPLLQDKKMKVCLTPSVHASVGHCESLWGYYVAIRCDGILFVVLQRFHVL